MPEEITTTPVNTDKAPEVDVTEITSNVKADVLAEIEAKFPELTENLSQKVKNDIIQRISGKTEEKHWQPATWDEVKNETKKEALAEFEALQKKKDAEQLDKWNQTQEEKKKVEEEFNKYWDDQLNDLQKDGLLPELPKEIVTKLAKNEALTEAEQKHPAVKARTELYATAKELKDEGKRDWYNLELIYHRLNRAGKISGREAPVQNKGQAQVQSHGNTFKYSDIHNKSTLQILREAQQEQ